MSNWRNDKPTKKQLDYIKRIEIDAHCKFNGTTKGEACDYISKYKDDIYKGCDWDECDYWGDFSLYC